MSKEMKKKERWGKPKLIVLVRGRPEEAVLAICRGGSGIITSGPNNAFTPGCMLTAPSCRSCSSYSVVGRS